MVEDDEEDWILNRSYLSDCPFRSSFLRWSRNLAEAKAALRESRFDLVFADLNLPDSRGLQTLHALQEVSPDSTFILLTGLEDANLGAQAVQSGAQDYLVKGQVDGRIMGRSIRHSLERKASERALREYRENLEELVRKRTEGLREANAVLRNEIAERKRVEEELRRAVERVKQDDEAKTQFVSNVSHELRTPLTSMAYALDNMLGGVVGHVDDHFRGYLEMLSEDCQRLIRTVNDILDLSRIEAQTLVLHCVKTPFHRMVLQAVGSLQMLASEKRVMLAASGEMAHGIVACDRDKMNRVLMNILQNAVKYTPSGGFVDVELVADPRDPAWMTVLVKDTGIGIPAEYIGRVTERYFRIDEEVTGSGLGLAIAREVLELHGGRIEIASPVPGREGGTQVSLKVPRCVGSSILLAMGSVSARERATGELAADGFSAVPCSDASDALRRMQANTPDGLVLDFALEGMDAVEMIARVKSHLAWKSVPLVVVGDAAQDGAVRNVLDGFHIPLVRQEWTSGELAAALEKSMLAKG